MQPILECDSICMFSLSHSANGGTQMSYAIVVKETGVVAKDWDGYSCIFSSSESAEGFLPILCDRTNTDPSAYTIKPW